MKINFKNFKVIRTTRLLFIFKQIDLFLKEEPIHVHLYNNLYRLFSSEDLFNTEYESIQNISIDSILRNNMKQIIITTNTINKSRIGNRERV